VTVGFFYGRKIVNKKPDFERIETRWQAVWKERGTYDFKPEGKEIFSIDTPLPTVSGKLHMGHVYSYCHADFLARFWRMNGRAVFYPMGYDDNGLPTEHLVEREMGQRLADLGVDEFRRQCLQIGERSSGEYEQLWRRLGLSVDWSLSYGTISARSQKLAQWSFLDLYEKGYIYRREVPVLWCPQCQTAIAQAELEERQRESDFCELLFRGESGGLLKVATTRPELLPACAAVFVHPDDERYQQ
jgi:valyl-tRNA synthetase